MSDDRPPYGGERWDANRVRRLRGHVGDTQREFAERLGTRQQTVSEWETGTSHPRAMARRLLHLVAEEGGFYRAEELREEHGVEEQRAEQRAALDKPAPATPALPPAPARETRSAGPPDA